jgi:hypothetical protein
VGSEINSNEISGEINERMEKISNSNCKRNIMENINCKTTE